MYRTIIPGLLLLFFTSCGGPAFSGSEETISGGNPEDQTEVDSFIPAVKPLLLDTQLFDRIQLHLVHGEPNERWPVDTEYPLPGALLPFHRIVAYYGNLYSKGMGILGALPADKMLERLKGEVKKWSEADTVSKAIPALHYIAVTAQRDPGAGNKYRLRMPYHQIDKILELAEQIDAVVFLDVQVGHSTLESELPYLEKYLSLPQVHLGIDPEYSMKNGRVPGTSIGTFDATDINFASKFLAELVRKHRLPPKVLVVHRFTQGMVTNSKKIETRPEVQIVIHMDGFGFPAKKENSYRLAVTNEPVQFAGFKLFYKNDTADPRWPNLMTPEEILKLYPKPVYIQYQ